MKDKKILAEEKESLLKSEISPMEENTKLREEIKTLKPILEKFTIDSQKLQLILNNQKVIFDKVGIDFNPLRK